MKRKGPKDRKKRIVAILKERKRVPVSVLEKDLAVPASTIRRDLREMVQDGQVARSHGYVEFKKNSASLLPEAEDEISDWLVECYFKAMSQILAETRFMFTGFGYIPEEIVKSLEGKEVVTNCLGVAIAAGESNTETVIGETLNSHTYCLSTRNWQVFLHDRIFETILLEAEGFDESSFYASDEHFWLLKEMLSLSTNVMLVCRQARYGKANSRKIAYGGNIHKVFTDVEEFYGNVKDNPSWAGIDVVNVNDYAMKVEPQVVDHPSGRMGNVVYPNTSTWKDGKHKTRE